MQVHHVALIFLQYAHYSWAHWRNCATRWTCTASAVSGITHGGIARPGDWCNCIWAIVAVYMYARCCVWCIVIFVTTGKNWVDGALTVLSQDGSSVMSFDQLCMPELSCGNHATGSAAVKNEALLTMDKCCQLASVEPPVCAASLLVHSPFCDPHVACTTRPCHPVASSSPLPCYAAMPPAVCHLGCHQRHADSSRPVSESTPAYTLPVPSDAVLVRPRMPMVAGKHETTSSPPVTVPSLSSAAHGAGGFFRVDGNSQETRSIAGSVYGDGFCAPPANSSTASHSDALAAGSSFSCCPHCGVGFVATAVPRNVIYHPTGPSYIIHSLTPAIQPCYSVTVNSVVMRPAAAATYAAGGAAAFTQPQIRLADGAHQQVCTRLPVPPHQTSPSPPSFVSASPSVNVVRLRTARPPPSCANCGGIGHTQSECKEPTIDTTPNARK